MWVRRKRRTNQWEEEGEEEVGGGRGKGKPKHELRTGQAVGQLLSKHVYPFIFQKMPFLGG